MTPLYAVVQTRYEYDDSRYYESGNYAPKNAYRSEEKAKLEATRLNYEFMQVEPIDLYHESGDWSEFFTPEAAEALEKILPIVQVHMEMEIPDLDDVAAKSDILRTACKFLDFETMKPIIQGVRVAPFSVTCIYLDDSE